MCIRDRSSLFTSDDVLLTFHLLKNDADFPPNHKLKLLFWINNASPVVSTWAIVLSCRDHNLQSICSTPYCNNKNDNKQKVSFSCSYFDYDFQKGLWRMHYRTSMALSAFCVMWIFILAWLIRVLGLHPNLLYLHLRKLVLLTI